MYKLSPVQAYDLGLVKQIEVDSVISEKSFNQPFIRVESIKALKTKLTAKLTIDIAGAKEIRRKPVTVKNGDNLFDLSKEREQYREGCIINEINAEDGYVEFSNGKRLEIGATQGGYQDDIMSTLLRKRNQDCAKQTCDQPSGRRFTAGIGTLQNFLRWSSGM